MDQSNVAMLVVVFRSLLVVSVIVASILIFSGGKVDDKIPEKSRKSSSVRGELNSQANSGGVPVLA